MARVAFVMQNTQDVTDIHQLKGDVGIKPMPGRAALGSSILARAERVQALNDTLLAESAQLRNLFIAARRASCASCGGRTSASSSPTRPS